VKVVALTMYTTGYCTKVQEVRRHQRSIYCGVPRLAKLTCVRAARPESVTVIEIGNKTFNKIFSYKLRDN
jgi:hypothetical protein